MTDKYDRFAETMAATSAALLRSAPMKECSAAMDDWAEVALEFSAQNDQLASYVDAAVKGWYTDRTAGYTDADALRALVDEGVPEIILTYAASKFIVGQAEKLGMDFDTDHMPNWQRYCTELFVPILWGLPENV